MAEKKDVNEEALNTKKKVQGTSSEEEMETEEVILEEPEEMPEQEESGDKKDSEEKKGLFGKKKEKKDPRDLQIEDLTDRLKRQMAEFDNYRKRTDKEKSAMYEIGAKDIISKILPIVDNFERGLSLVSEEQKSDSFVEGMDLVYKQLLATLEELEVKPIEAVGSSFDPNLHNAVMHVEDEEMEENTVAEEFLKGYTYRGSVVRNSMVKVAN
jgi:molecular chaperone GrpE